MTPSTHAPATRAFDLIRGVTYDKAASSTTEVDGFLPVLRAGNISDGQLNLRSDLVFVPPAYVKSDQLLKPGDIVMATSSGSLSVVGKTGLLRFRWRGSFGAFCACLRPKPGWDPAFIAFYLQTNHIRQALSESARGVNINNLRRDHIEALTLPDVGLGQQRQIVAAIETHFSRLDAAVASLTRAKANVKRARASVLKAAVEGRLVPTEAELARAEARDYEPASVLLERILAERKAQWAASGAKGKYKEPVKPEVEGLPELPDGWALASLDALSTRLTSGSRDWSRYYGRGDSVFLLAQNVRRRQLDLSTIQLVDPPPGDPACARSLVRGGDLLVTIVGANTGDACRVPLDLARHYVCQSVALIRPVDPGLARYVEIWLDSEPLSRIWERFMYGQGRPHLSFDDLRRSPVLLPPAEEQARIVAQVDRRLSVLDALDATLDANLARCARLRQSILKRAFAGKLVEHLP